MTRTKDKQMSHHEINLLRSMLADMVGERDWVRDMQYRPDPNGLPRSLNFEAGVLRALEVCSREEVQPTAQNIAIVMSGDEHNFANELDHVEEFVRKYRHDIPEPRATAHALKNAIQVSQVVGALDNAKQQLLLNADPLEGHRQAMSVLREARPIAIKAPGYHATELSGRYREIMAQRVERARSGRPPGPIFPWAPLRRHISSLRRGDMNTCVGRAGVGKSTIVDALANYWAFDEQAGGYYVLIIAVENTEETFRDRQIVRNLRIPMYVLENGRYRVGNSDPRYGDGSGYVYLDESNPEWMAALDAFDAELEELERERGRVYYQPHIGATLDDIANYVEEHRQVATDLGMELILILDYANEVINAPSRWGNRQDDPTTNSIMKGLKNIISEYNIHSWIFMQDQVDPNYSNNKADTYNGQVAYMRSQVYIRLEAEFTDDEEQRMDQQGKPLRFNATNDPIYWHTAGSLSSFVTWNVMKVNNGNPGSGFTSRICRPTFELFGMETPKKKK